MLMPTVSRYMTRSLHVVGPRDKLSKARALMRRHNIHHVPVLDGSARLVGILSDRDLAARTDETVVDAMSVDVATVDENATLDEVVALMQTGRINSVVVTGKGGVEGIFTSTDALRALNDVLQRSDAAER
jgi:acetoin utilization protein AcuB